MGLIGCQEDSSSSLQYLLRLPIMEHLGSEQIDASVAMLVVVPREKGLAKNPGRFDREESVWEIRPILERLELGLGERVIIARMRAAVRFGDAKIGQKKRHGL